MTLQELSDHRLSSSHGPIDADLSDDDSSTSFYEEEDLEEDDLKAAEARFEQKYGLSDDEEEGSLDGSLGPGSDEDDGGKEESSFAQLYGHMSTGSALSDGDITLDTIDEGEVREDVIDLGIMKKEKSQEEAVDYGYGEAVPDSDKKAVDYGYGDAAPDTHNRQQPSARPKFVRRSSLKSLNGSSHSRASLCVGDEIEIHLPSREKTIKRRRSINFIEEVDVKHIEKVTEIDGKKEELWFQPTEFKEIAVGAYRDAGKALKGDKTADTRGLESILNEETLDKRVDKVIDIVMDEQDIQYDNLAFDEQKLSEKYTLFAVDSKIDARIRARRDEREVEEYLRDARRSMRRLSM